MKGKIIAISNGWATVEFRNDSTFDFWLFAKELKVGDIVTVVSSRSLREYLEHATPVKPTVKRFE